ncbi:MFS polyamine transporter [Cristinia sonorae]|uniref:MFS polyamine transporter n=1 Tax=Cristinia sonorae TaxID=1940300 RepID=A0A8K0ULX1_9AGAR|nr:MFS polyamine transporter [Cristinia sonorae]
MSDTRAQRKNSDQIVSSSTTTLQNTTPTQTLSNDDDPYRHDDLNNKQSDEDNDILLVDWDGPDDPQNPKNWSKNRKWAATLIVSSFTFVSPISSAMMAPSSEVIAREFHVTNSVITAMMTSMFVLGYAFGPLFLGPLSEIYGRTRVLQLSNLWYAAWNLGCGFAQDEKQLIVFRLMAGLGGSAPLSIGGGLLGDLWRPEERGQALALYSLAPILGPSLGPLAGAWVTERTTWRWVFWSTTIFDALIQILGLFFLQETFAPVVLERKAVRIRQGMDPEKSGHKEVRTVFDSADRHWQNILKKALFRPWGFFIYEPIIQLLGIYIAFVYGLLYLYLTTIPGIFEGVYQQSTGIAGLHYLAFGIGLTGASQLNARLMDRAYIYYTKKNGGQGRPEYRLLGMIPGTWILPIGLFISGWTARADIHWIVPDIGMAFVAAGMILNYQCIQTYVIDAFTLHAASALAATGFLRALCAFGFPLFAPTMYRVLGFGWGDTILAIFGIVVGCPAPYIFWKYGQRIRNASKYAA